MSPALKGRCPTAHAPMRTGDGLLGRVKPPLGEISSDAARAIAGAAVRYGSGRIELTNRGAIQVRGLSPASAGEFCQTIIDAGLASADAAVERRRNVALTPFADPHVTALARAIEQWLEADNTSLAALPPKFGFAVDSARSPAPPLAADIRCVDENDRWRIELDGGTLAAMTHDPFDAAIRLTRSFLALASETENRPRRMRELVSLLGAEAVHRHANLAPTTAPAQPRIPSCAMVGWSGDSWRGFGLGCPFGSLDAPMLLAAADLADRYADGRLHITASRALLLRDVMPADAEALTAAAGEAGFIVAPQDPRLAITACVGRPACSSAAMPTRSDAAELLAMRPAWLGAGVHLSGCSKGCAHPEAASITLVGTASGYDVVLNGRSSDAPTWRHLSLTQAIRLLNERFPTQP